MPNSLTSGADASDWPTDLDPDFNTRSVK